jgi:hypothetical protein
MLRANDRKAGGQIGPTAGLLNETNAFKGKTTKTKQEN